MARCLLQLPLPSGCITLNINRGGASQMLEAEHAELEEVRVKIADLERALTPLRLREVELERTIWGGPPASFHKLPLE